VAVSPVPATTYEQVQTSPFGHILWAIIWSLNSLKVNLNIQTLGIFNISSQSYHLFYGFLPCHLHEGVVEADSLNPEDPSDASLGPVATFAGNLSPLSEGQDAQRGVPASIA
jgi:hypothetical protein